jgi:hypothetical protein
MGHVSMLNLINSTSDTVERLALILAAVISAKLAEIGGKPFNPVHGEFMLMSASTSASEYNLELEQIWYLRHLIKASFTHCFIPNHGSYFYYLDT